jgi:hypothetical protein
MQCWFKLLNARVALLPSPLQRLLSLIAKIDQDYYPEHLGTMFIINTGWFFSTVSEQHWYDFDCAKGRATQLHC